jgi:membrane protein implicated in regulation of membrane protease activity
MKRAAVALHRLLLAIARAVGLEGVFLLIGTALLAVAASYVSPAGPWFVAGIMFTLAGVALATPPRRA